MLNFNPSLLGPLFQFKDYQLSVTTADQILIPANPQRILIAFSAPGGLYYVRPNTSVGLNFGMPIPSNNNLILSIADWGSVICSAWHMLTPTATKGYAIEVWYTPEN